MTIALIIIAIIASACVTYFCLRPRLQVTRQLDKEIADANETLRNDNTSLRNDNQLLKNQQLSLQQSNQTATNQLELLNKNIAALEQQSLDAANKFYEANMQIVKDKLESDTETERLKYEKAKESYEKELLQLMADSAIELSGQLETKKQACSELEEQRSQLQSDVEAAVAAAKRAEEIKNQADFYKLQLSDMDLEEIRMLKNIAPYLRDQEPLNKVIWKVYYEKPTTDLIGRVIGLGVHTGIYKITDLDSNKCYVGQAANLADRWKQHIKRGLGAETPTRNKLYPAMMAIGVENFSFEVIEECSRDQLDAREDYWQEYFKAKEFGYSIK